MIVRAMDVMDGAPSIAALRSCLREHRQNAIRLEMLGDYYGGRHGVLRRDRASGLPNNRLVNAFPRYISSMASGYLVGNPVVYHAPEGQRAALDAVLRAYEGCAIDSVDAEIARQASIYGRAVELVFADAEARVRTAAIEPVRAFVVYDDTVEHRPLFGVHLSPVLRADGEAIAEKIDVYTADCVYHYNAPLYGEPRECASCDRHFFGGVPMIETWNGEDERGDFECVISLIDAYDFLQSDRVNDKQQFVDALLLLYGCTMETDARGRSPGQQLREDKVLALPDADARAEWLFKQLSEGDVEILKGAICADIHKMSMVPDMTDQNFAGNSSGVAMRYKLLGLEQLTRIKERWFKEALRERMARFAHFLSVRGAQLLDVSQVEMAFSRALPVNGLEEAQTIEKLKGLVSDEELSERARRIQ